MMKKAKVEGHSNLERDLHTNAIIDTDKQAYQKYIMDRQQRQYQSQTIENLKSELDEIKSLLKEFINGSKSNNT